MPVHVRREEELFCIECVKSYPADELLGALDQILATPDFPEGARLLLDLRLADSVIRRPRSELKHIAYKFVPRAAAFGGRCALLVEGLARYGLMRMAATWMQLEGIDARVFRDLEEAKRWLVSPLADKS